MPGIGPFEILILLLVALVVFGPKRLPEMGRSLGRGMREFKDSISTSKDEPYLDPVHEQPQGAGPQRAPGAVRDGGPDA